MVGLHTRVVQAIWFPKVSSRNFRAQRLGANVISPTTSFAPTRGAPNVKMFQGALAYDFCRPPILIFFLREISQRVSSASALGRFFLNAHSQGKSYLKFCMASANSFFLMGHFLRTSWARTRSNRRPRSRPRGALKTSRPLSTVNYHPFSPSLHPPIRSPHSSFLSPHRHSSPA